MGAFRINGPPSPVRSHIPAYRLYRGDRISRVHPEEASLSAFSMGRHCDQCHNFRHVPFVESRDIVPHDRVDLAWRDCIGTALCFHTKSHCTRCFSFCLQLLSGYRPGNSHPEYKATCFHHLAISRKRPWCLGSMGTFHSLSPRCTISGRTGTTDGYRGSWKYARANKKSRPNLSRLYT